MAIYADWGTTLVETDIDKLVIAQLRLWLPTYLSRAEVDRGLANGLLARPKASSFQNALQDDDFPDGALPAIVVTTAQTEGQPMYEANQVSAAWRCNVSAVVRGKTPGQAREVAAVFGGAVRRVLRDQQIGLDGEVKWRAGQVVPISDQTGKERLLCASLNRFTVFTDVVMSGDGPLVPLAGDPPYPAPDPASAPNAPYDPLVPVKVGGVTTTIIKRS